MNDIRRPAHDLFTAGQPTRAQLASLAAEGVRTVINLRAPSEPMEFDEAAETARLDMDYVSIPVSGAQDLTQETLDRFSRALAGARERGPVLVHCASANRVGALLAMDHALCQGGTCDDALAFGRKAGLAGLEPAVEGLIRQGAGS